MADPKKRRSENVPGNFFVDSTCIDCGMCFWMGGDTFREENDMAAVYRQPTTEKELFEAAQSLVSCPVGSIGTEKPVAQIKAATESFPFSLTEDLFLTGFHSKKAYGATSYLLKHPSGNVMIDSPRFLSTLAKKIEAMGGIKTIFLTHLDDIGDHDLYHKHFGCDRVILSEDWNPGMGEMERKLETKETWLAEDLKVIPVPGHTKGHAALLYKEKYLFTGDHLAWSREKKQLIAFRDALWYSWEVQKESMKSLRRYSFEWVLPGHGERYYTEKTSMKTELEKCIAWMETC